MCEVIILTTHVLSSLRKDRPVKYFIWNRLLQYKTYSSFKIKLRKCIITYDTFKKALQLYKAILDHLQEFGVNKQQNWKEQSATRKKFEHKKSQLVKFLKHSNELE